MLAQVISKRHKKGPTALHLRLGIPSVPKYYAFNSQLKIFAFRADAENPRIATKIQTLAMLLSFPSMCYNRLFVSLSKCRRFYSVRRPVCVPKTRQDGAKVSDPTE